MYRASPPAPIHLEVEFVAQDLVDAQRLHMRPGKRFRIFLYCTLPPVLAGAAYLFYDWIRAAPLMKHDPAGLALPMLISFVVLWFWFLPSQARKRFAQLKSLHGKQVFDFDAGGMRASSPRGNTNIPWSDFRGWKVNERVLILLQADVVMTVVPLRALPDAALKEALLALVENGIGTHEGGYRRA
jgi:hypothetical protein